MKKLILVILTLVLFSGCYNEDEAKQWKKEHNTNKTDIYYCNGSILINEYMGQSPVGKWFGYWFEPKKEVLDYDSELCKEKYGL